MHVHLFCHWIHQLKFPIFRNKQKCCFYLWEYIKAATRNLNICRFCIIHKHKQTLQWGHHRSTPCPATSQSCPIGPSADSGPRHFHTAWASPDTHTHTSQGQKHFHAFFFSSHSFFKLFSVLLHFPCFLNSCKHWSDWVIWSINYSIDKIFIDRF